LADALIRNKEWTITFAGRPIRIETLGAAGWACVWERLSSNTEPYEMIFAHRRARRMTLGYFGHIKDWIEFLALPEKYRPAFFANASIKLDGALTFAFSPMSAAVAAPALTDSALLDVFVANDPLSPIKQKIIDISVHPLPTIKTFKLSIVPFSSPIEDAAHRYEDARRCAEMWKTCTTRKRRSTMFSKPRTASRRSSKRSITQT
jgi:hypothetical protein